MKEINNNDTKVKIDGLEWRVDVPIASKAQVQRVRLNFFFISISFSRATRSLSFSHHTSMIFPLTVFGHTPLSFRHKQMRENAGGEEASSTAVAMDARASAVLILRGKSGSDDASAGGGGGGGGVPVTTSIRLSEEDCLKLQNSMDEMATRVKEVMEKYGEGEKGGE